MVRDPGSAGAWSSTIGPPQASLALMIRPHIGTTAVGGRCRVAAALGVEKTLDALTGSIDRKERRYGWFQGVNK
jgi:hypothetical protein